MVRFKSRACIILSTCPELVPTLQRDTSLDAPTSSERGAQERQQQARLCEEFTIEGFNPDRTAIPLLEDVFVPLDLSGAISSGSLTDDTLINVKNRRAQYDPSLLSENLDIWKLLARTRKDRKFRQMSILAKGGMGKTTLLRHINLIYSQGKLLCI